MSRLSWNEAAKNAWDERAAHWHANSVAMWKNGSRKDIIPFFKNHILLGSVADLGCGDGYGSMLLNNEGYDVIGMDISEEMIRIATKKEQSSLSFVVGDLNKPPFQDEQFSAVMAINSLEWTEDPLHALNQVRRITKVGGFACVGILGPTAMPRVNSYPRLLGEKVICNTMMPWEFEKLATEHGWKKVAEKGVYKKGVEEGLLSGLTNDLKQALTFMQLFILQRVK